MKINGRRFHIRLFQLVTALSTPRNSILGIHIHATDYTTATDTIVAAAKEKRTFGASALAVHGVMTGVTNAIHRGRLNSLEYLVPDGQPVRWALNWIHQSNLSDRVYGPFLTKALCARAEQEGLRVFFYGSDEATLAELRQKLSELYPQLIIAGMQPSRFRRATGAEWQADVTLLREAAPDIVFCGLGCPRQEIWVYEMREYISVPLVAVGAAFPFLAGKLEMAPPWMQRRGLEWFYRLSREPLRLWRRYLLFNPMFLIGVCLQKIGVFAESHRTCPKSPAQRWS